QWPPTSTRLNWQTCGFSFRGPVKPFRKWPEGPTGLLGRLLSTSGPLRPTERPDGSAILGLGRPIQPLGAAPDGSRVVWSDGPAMGPALLDMAGRNLDTEVALISPQRPWP